MITKQNPKEMLLFSRFDSLLSPAARKTLDRSWQGVFRRSDPDDGIFGLDPGRGKNELYGESWDTCRMISE